MSQRVWIGGAGGKTYVALVARATFATYDVATTRTISIGTGVNAVSVSALDSGGTLTAALTALAVLLNASVHPYFAAITWTSDATHIIGTSDVLGAPFVFAGSVSGGTGTVTSAFAITTANLGPNDWGTAENWSGGVVPTSSDNVVIDGTSAYAILFGLNTATYFPTLRIDQPETAVLGLGPNFTTDVAGATEASPIVPEYRTGSLTMTGAAQAVACTIGRQFGPNDSTGTGRCRIDFGDTAATVEIWNSAAVATDDGVMPIQLLFNNANYALLYVRSGLVSIGPRTETVVLASLVVSDTSSFSRVIFGTGVTCPIITVAGGTHSVMTCASQTITVNGGRVDIEGSTTLTTLACNAGSTYVNGALTVTNPTVQSGALLNCRAGGRSITLTSLILNRGCIYQSGSNVTHTNPISIPNGIYQLNPT